jgi:hypothetical protein
MKWVAEGTFGYVPLYFRFVSYVNARLPKVFRLTWIRHIPNILVGVAVLFILYMWGAVLTKPQQAARFDVSASSRTETYTSVPVPSPIDQAAPTEPSSFDKVDRTLGSFGLPTPLHPDIVLYTSIRPWSKLTPESR